MSSRARLLCDCVADQLSVHEVGQAAFQAAHGFVVIFAFGSFPQVIGPAGGIVADLGEGHDVQAEIELAIAGAGKPVAHHLAGGHLDGGGAGVTGERGGRAEATNITDAAEDLARGQCAEAV